MRKHPSISANLATVACFLTLLWPLEPLAFGQQGARVELGSFADRRKCLVHPLRIRRVGHRDCGGPCSAHPAAEARKVRSISRRQRHSAACSGLQEYTKTSAGIDAEAEMAYGKNVVFRVHDKWSVSSRCSSCKEMWK